MTERLEEIKEAYRWTIDNSLVPRLSDSDTEWLIEQAERALKNAEDLEDMDKQLAGEQKRVRELEKGIENLNELTDMQHEQILIFHRQLNQLIRTNQRYKQALEFYADPMIWREGNRIKGNTFEMPLANNDNGHKARKALEETE